MTGHKQLASIKGRDDTGSRDGRLGQYVEFLDVFHVLESYLGVAALRHVEVAVETAEDGQGQVAWRLFIHSEHLVMEPELGHAEQRVEGCLGSPTYKEGGTYVQLCPSEHALELFPIAHFFKEQMFQWGSRDNHAFKVLCHQGLYIGIEAVHVCLGRCLVGEVAHHLRNTPNVIGFLGGTDKPVPLRQSEVNRILGTVDELQENPQDVAIPYVVGETVKVNYGPFSGFSGIIEEVNTEKKKLKVMVKIFGRKTPLELGFMQVEKE